MKSSELRLAALARLPANVPNPQVAALSMTDEQGKELYRLRLIGLTLADDVASFGKTPEQALDKFVADVIRRFAPLAEQDFS